MARKVQHPLAGLIDLPKHVLFARSESRILRMGALAGVIFLLAVVSIVFSRMSGGSTIVWLPDAFAIALALSMKREELVELVCAHFAAVLMANFVCGGAVLLSFNSALSHVFEASLGFVLCRLFARSDAPFANERTYLSYLAALFVTSLISSAVGSGLLFHAAGGGFLEGYFDRILQSLISLTAFVPFFLLLQSAKMRALELPHFDGFKVSGCLAAIVGLLYLSVYVHEEIRILFLLIVLLALMGMWLRAVNMMILSACLPFAIALTAFAQQEMMIADGNFGLGSELFAFAATFFALSIPGSLNAIVLERLHAAETQQRILNQTQAEFLSTMSHETMTPLNVISGVLQLLKRRNLDDKSEKLVRAGLQAADAITHQTRQYLMISGLQERQLQLMKTTLDVSTLLEDWKEATLAEIASLEKPLRVVVTPPAADIPRILADASRLHQVFLNLTSNAVKFSESGTITLSAVCEGSNVLFRIKDEGCGIATEEHDFVFRRFWQQDSSQTRSKPGAGIGLAVCLELIEYMGGAISLTSQMGAGTEFEIRLPVADE